MPSRFIGLTLCGATRLARERRAAAHEPIRNLPVIEGKPQSRSVLISVQLVLTRQDEKERTASTGISPSRCGVVMGIGMGVTPDAWASTTAIIARRRTSSICLWSVCETSNERLGDLRPSYLSAAEIWNCGRLRACGQEF